MTLIRLPQFHWCRRFSRIEATRGAFQSCWSRYGLALYRLLLVGLAAWACQWSLRAVWRFTIDDAGISYAYAKHIAEGHGPVAAIGGPWVEGYSNPSWVFLLVPFHWLGMPLPSVAKLLGAALFCAALIFGAVHLALTDERRWRSFGAAEVSLAVAAAVCLEVAVWVVAGLENALFSALLLLLACLDAHESQRPDSIGLSGLVAFGLCITRPEGVLYAAPLLAIKLVQVLRKREPLRQAANAALLFMAPLAVYHTAHYLIFGELVPNTYYAKPGSLAWAKGYEYLLENLRDSALLYALPLVLIGMIGKPRLKLLLAWSCVAGSVFVLYSGGDWMPHGRFLALFALPGLVLVSMGVSNLSHGVAWLGRRRLPREGVLLVMAGGLLWFWWSHHAPRLHRLAKQPWCQFCERVTDTSTLQGMAKRADLPSLSLLTHDFGGPAWLSDERLYPIDFLGLCDRSVGLLRHDRSTDVNGPSAMRNDFRFYQYFMHEQPSPPSWLLVPPNFWRHFDLSPEYRWGYFRLSPRLLPRARRDAFFGLHRAELVDYFPPLSRAEFRSLTPRLTLVGAASFSGPARHAEGRATDVAAARAVHTWVSVVPRGPQRGTEQLKLRIDAGDQRLESDPVSIARELKGVADQLQDGQPLSFELSVALPAAGPSAHRIWLGVSQPEGKGEPDGATAAGWAFSELGELAPGAALPALSRALPRYPAALPAPLHPELLRLRQPVTMAIEQRRHDGHAVPADSSLSRRLLDLAQDFEAAGDAPQAYLSYVWATHVDRRVWEVASDAIFRLRQVAVDDRHTTELALLEHYYSTGHAAALARLVAYYLAESRPLEANHFFRWRPPSTDSPTSPPATSAPAIPASASASIAGEGSWGALAAALTAQLDSSRALVPSESEQILEHVAVDPLGHGLDFETAELDGWEGTKQVYFAGPSSDRRALKAIRGYHGRGVLASLQGGKGARGSLLSAEFPLRGRMLSLLVGGGSRKRRVGVELIVDGKAVRSAHGNDSDFMYPELWDVAEYEGKAARLRVFDRSPRSYVLIDRVLLWQ